MNNLIIIGAGGYGNTIADICEQLNIFSKISFLDDHKVGGNVIGKSVEFKNLIDDNTVFYPAFGNNELRIKWINDLLTYGAKVATIIHPRAFVSPKAGIEPGVVVLPGAVVNTNSLIKRGTIININAVVDHDCIIEEGGHICIGAIIKAENRIPSCAKIEAGEIIQNKIFKI